MPFSGLATMTPGGGMNVPGNIGGGGKRPSNWWALAAAPIAALIAQGIGGVGFGEGLGAFGQGFANEKYNQLRQRRDREFEEEGRTIDLAHKAVQDLKDVDSETLAKFPQLQSLSQKYQEALADDGKISAKEAKDIVVLNQHLQHELSQAKNSQALSHRENQMRQDQELEDRLKAESLGRGFPGTEGASQEEMADVGGSLLDQMRMAEMPQLTSVKLGDEERQLMMTPMQQFQLAKEEEHSQRADQAEQRRLASQESMDRFRASAEGARERGLNMRESAADFRDQVQEWRDNRQAALDELIANAGGDRTMLDPKELAEFDRAWEAIRPRKNGRSAIAPPPKPASVPAPSKPSSRFKLLSVE